MLERTQPARPCRQSAALVLALLPVLVPAAAPASAPAPSTAAADDLGRRLEAVARDAARDGFHGVVLATRKGEDLLHAGYGLAREQPPTPFTPATVVQIGSNVKDFTKVAIFQLVEAGKARLEDPLGRFFPQAPAPLRDVTVDQLLEMRSGLPLGFARDDETLDKERFFERLWATRLESPPGTRERYSNLGYSVLAAIVEHLTGEGFDGYVARAILAPLGLRETGLLGPGFDRARLAHGYDGGQDRGTVLDLPRDAHGHLWALRGNGGYVATVRDQSTFYRALAEGKLLGRDELRRRVFDPSGPTVLAGSDLVCSFLYAWYPGPGIELVIASNHGEFPAQRLHQSMEAALGLGPPAGFGGVERVLQGRGDGGSSEPTVELPTEGPWSTVVAWFTALQSGDEGRMRAFFERHAAPNPEAPPLERRLENSRRLRATLQGHRVVGAERGPDGLDVRVRLANGDPALLRFQVSPEAPFLLHGIQVQVG